ncbi:LysR family transcriptional regulator [uncultured Spongiibacter sp.]|uniref:LysR family transcriptional regulator n=1 Tax=uncultured Spongiibacter sp. TaxID=870896 RepID=UPI0025898D31|nr:LysR family transcriptional regulator [uncultured Spongiibacter sp.]
MSDILKADLNALKVLDVLLDECSVSQAAKRLHVTQPSVSYTLQKLRDLFDDPLFVRNPRGLTPTSRAESLRPAIKQLLSDAQQLIAPPVFVPEEAEFTLSISANDYLQTALIVPLLQRIRALAPKVKVALFDLDSKAAAKRVRGGELDLMLSFPQALPADFSSEELFTDPYIAAARQGHPLADQQASAESFLRYDHVIVSPTGFAFEGGLFRDLHHSPLLDRVAVTLPNFAVLPSLLAGSDLIAMIPRRLLSVMSGPLSEVKIAATMPSITVAAAWHPRLDHDLAHRWVRNLLRAEALLA